MVSFKLRFVIIVVEIYNNLFSDISKFQFCWDKWSPSFGYIHKGKFSAIDIFYLSSYFVFGKSLQNINNLQLEFNNRLGYTKGECLPLRTASDHKWSISPETSKRN